MKRILAYLTMVTWTSTAFAGSTTLKQIDNIQNSTGGSAIAVPSVGATFASDSNTLTFTNKTMSGASNTFSNIPVGAIGNGSVLSGTNTGDVTIAAFGSTPNAFGLSLSGQALNIQPADATHPGGISISDWNTFNNKLSSALTQNHIFVGNASNVATDVAMSGDATIVASGALTLATVNGNVGSFTSANITVNAKGLITAASSGASSTPAINGGSGSPQAVTAAGGISLSGIAYNNFVWVVGSPGAVIVTATPSITACTLDGQRLTVIGTDATKTVKLQDDASLSGSGLFLNGPVILGLYKVISLHCDVTLGAWVEDSRSY